VKTARLNRSIVVVMAGLDPTRFTHLKIRLRINGLDDHRYGKRQEVVRNPSVERTRISGADFVVKSFPVKMCAYSRVKPGDDGCERGTALRRSHTDEFLSFPRVKHD
jgi:hypothetical protein